MTKIQVLSHACLLVSTEFCKIIVDPWLIGSCYWRSWWNYPEPDIEAELLEDVDAVFLSHIHWDHWHGPTLKRFFKNAPIYIGDDPNPRSMRDLKSIGYEDVKVIRHGAKAEVGDISVSFYNFGTLLNDSALVIETKDVKILNANDAKIAGASLKYLIGKHRQFDFAFRSHSSANSRICYQTVIDSEKAVDDRDHYFRSFILFMDAVNPKYAIPFASNHCHLLEETFHYNDYVSKPSELGEFIKNNCGNEWRFEMMLPGSSWSSTGGFDMKNQNAFDDYEQKLREYQKRKSATLDRYRDREEKVEITKPLIARFEKMLSKCGRLGALNKVTFKLNKPSGVVKSLSWNGKALLEDYGSEVHCSRKEAVVAMPVSVFRDAVMKNMFHHAAISKRCLYFAYDQNDLDSLQRFMTRLERLELKGNSLLFWPRWLARQLKRRPDAIVYAYAFYYRFLRKMPLYLVEEAILMRHSGVKSRPKPNK